MSIACPTSLTAYYSDYVRPVSESVVHCRAASGILTPFQGY